MSKELTPLEALEELRYRITNFNGKFHNYNKLMGTIETALKRLEEIDNRSYMRIENILPHIFDDNENLKKRLDETQERLWEKQAVIEKQDKILRIVKEKRVDVGWLMSCENLSQYNNVIGTVNHLLLTQEEYDFLNEELL